MLQKTKIKMGSNRSFGVVFFIVFIIISLWPLLNGAQIKIWFFLTALVFLVLGLINSKLLNPLNRLWFKFGMLLGAIIAPVVMGIVFFLVVTPIGLIMKILGKDLLGKKFKKNSKSYWIKRDKPAGTMKQQF